VAANLATGIVTDTLGFRTSNTTPAALRQMALLMETGINMPDLYTRALVSRSFSAARYWGAGLSSLKTLDGMVYATLRLTDRKQAGYGGNDDADLINVISAIEDHAVGIIFVEQRDTVKISWRALQAGLDVAQIATHFGGGGHKAAAGADIPGTMEEIQPRVLQTTREMLYL
jgi:phosphoesterase RecJ-like protein